MSVAPRLAQVQARLAALEATQQAARHLGPAAAADPVALAAHAGFTPDPWQAEALQSTAQTLLICCARQTGKSVTIALLIAYTLLTPEQTVVVVSPSERQSKELARKVYAFWRKLGRPVAHVTASRTTMELVNGSRLEAFPATSDTIRGISAVNLLVADEAGIVPDDLYASVSPMLAVSQGRLVALSTPKGKRGWWWQLWDTTPEDDPDIARVLVTAEQCPRITPHVLARERRRVGEFWYKQEYGCEFLDQQTQAFAREDVDAAFREEVGLWDLSPWASTSASA